MATTYPVTMDELANITGVGQGKAKTLRRGLPARDPHSCGRKRDRATRGPQGVRSVANKSKQKIAIIQGH